MRALARVALARDARLPGRHTTTALSVRQAVLSGTGQHSNTGGDHSLEHAPNAGGDAGDEDGDRGDRGQSENDACAQRDGTQGQGVRHSNTHGRANQDQHTAQARTSGRRECGSERVHARATEECPEHAGGTAEDAVARRSASRGEERRVQSTHEIKRRRDDDAAGEYSRSREESLGSGKPPADASSPGSSHKRQRTGVPTYDETSRRGARKRKAVYLDTGRQREGAKRDSITAGAATLERSGGADGYNCDTSGKMCNVFCAPAHGCW